MDTTGKNTKGKRHVQQRESSVLNVESGTISQRFASQNEICALCKINKHEDGYPDVSSEFFIDCVTNANTFTSSEQAFAEIEIREYGLPLKFKLDTGAQVNVLPQRDFKKFAPKTKMQQTHKKLTGYGGQPLSVKGTCKLHCNNKENAMPLDFFIVDTQSPPVLGLKACLDLDMIKLVLSVSSPEKDSESIVDEFTDVFTGIGLFPGECNIQLDPTAMPVIHPLRRVPFALRDLLKEELDSWRPSWMISWFTENKRGT